MGSSNSRSYTPNSGQCGGNGENRGTISRMESTNNYVESVVCNENELKENEMKVFDIGEDGRVLVVKQKGEISAIGTKCTHYGAPLATGALGDGRVRCPWHGACFNIKTGDIEDFPGFDSLPCYQVTVSEKGEVKVRAKISDLKSNKRIKDVNIAGACDGSVVVIVGGGPSGATCAETLRSEGFKGRITLVAKENYLPYDRIKVSKIGTVTDIEKLQARTQQYYQDSNIEVLKGVEASKVDTNEKIVTLSDGNKLRYSALYVATGSSPRVPDIPGINLKNIFTVRNFDDSVNILNSLGSNKDKNVVVLGLSFIGLEIASSCNDKAKSMTVVGKDTAPLGLIFGNQIGQSLQKLFEDKGVKFQFKTTITKCNGDNGAIQSVELENGTTLPADILILGVGATFNTNFLKDTGIQLEPNGAVSVDDKLETNVKHVYAGGDIACAPVFAMNNKPMSIGHIGLAQYHGRVAALNILKKETPVKTVPFFWTMLFGKSIRYAGCGKPASTQVEGDVDALKFVIFFFDESDKVIAVASCMRDPVVAQFAEYTHQGKTLHKRDLKDDPFAWTKIN
ncbi:apoptosis-inducing factor 3 isoform X2 [Anticarsia gemmatalis]